MMTLIAAAALAAQSPTPPATDPMANHAQHQQSATDEKKDMDCCKDCCKDMGEGHSGHDMDHKQEHHAHSGG
jgi:sulfur relay (sulfurtransferase) complex TusBCD TusD component (DsrE family)